MDGKNPDSWADVREELPRLAEERWFEKVRHGYARGWEPVQFVDRVQRYLTLLEWQPGEGGGAPAAPLPAGQAPPALLAAPVREDTPLPLPLPAMAPPR